MTIEPVIIERLQEALRDLMCHLFPRHVRIHGFSVNRR